MWANFLGASLGTWRTRTSLILEESVIDYKLNTMSIMVQKRRLQCKIPFLHWHRSFLMLYWQCHYQGMWCLQTGDIHRYLPLWALAVNIVALLVNLPGKILVKVSKHKGLRCTVFELFKDMVLVALSKTVIRYCDSWQCCWKGKCGILLAFSVSSGWYL